MISSGRKMVSDNDNGSLVDQVPIKKQLTLRRMRDGAMRLFVDDLEVDGVFHVDSACDYSHSITLVKIANKGLHFDTEPVPKTELN